MYSNAEFLGAVPLGTTTFQQNMSHQTNQNGFSNFGQFSPQPNRPPGFATPPQYPSPNIPRTMPPLNGISPGYPPQNRLSPPRTSPGYPQPLIRPQPVPAQNYPVYAPPPQVIYSPPQVKYIQPPPVVIQQQPQVIVQQQPDPIVKEIHHIEKPLEVITIEEIEGPWRLKCATLERQILELQIQLRKGGLPTVETVEVQDDTRLKELEAKRNNLKDQLAQRDNEIEDLNNHIHELQMEIETVTTEKLSYFTTEVETWKRKYADLQREHTDAERELDKVNRELDQVRDQQKHQQQEQQITRSEVKRQSRIY